LATTFLNGIETTDALVQGSGAADTIVSIGTLQDSTLDGVQNDDTISYGGGTATDVLFDGGSQDDYLIFNSAGFTVTSLNDVTVKGGTGDDYLYFGYDTSFPEFYNGDYLAIDDSLIQGGGGDDYIAFNDNASLNDTLLNGNEGNDDIYAYGSVANSTIQGGQHNDYIGFSEDLDASRINGNLGNDEISAYDLTVGNGSSIFGGAGEDFIGLWDTTVDNSVVNGDKGADWMTFTGEDFTAILTDSEVYGADDSDTIIVANSDYFGHADVVRTLIDGGLGNDEIFVGEDVRVSASTILGGVGNDYIVIDEAGNDEGLWNTLIDGGQGNDYILVGEINAAAGVSSIIGGEGADSLLAYDNADAGAFWSGDAGNDSIRGGDGRDTIVGGDGNDRIDGDYRGDLLTGGAGNDIFNYYNSSDSNVNGSSAELGSNIDTITDFNANEDRFDMDFGVDYDGAFQVGFTVNWQTTIDNALAPNSGLDTDEVALVVITTGNNAGTYLVYNDDLIDGWNAGSDGIVRLDQPTGTISNANFI
jgi:Ca2+-binding RTX toxin-like protein